MYFILFKKFLEPFYEGFIKKRHILEYRAFLEESQWWSSEKLAAYQATSLQKLLRHAYENTEYYRQLFNREGITPDMFRSMEDFKKIPVLQKKVIIDHQDQLIADTHRGKTWSKSTGGSTGEPLHFHYTPDSYDWRMACTRRGYGWAGAKDGIKTLHIWSVLVGDIPLLHRIKEKLHHLILRRRYINCFEWGPAKMEAALKIWNRFQPKVVITYTNPIYRLAQFVKVSDRTPVRPLGIITAAEKLYDFQREVIEQAFQCPVFNSYGSREFMLMASECSEQHRMHINIENVYLEILREDGSPAAPGEVGSIVVTDLHNFGMPFIRYQTGDLGVISPETCACGRALPILDDVVGRSADMLLTPDGGQVVGVFFPHLMKEYKGIRQFQVIQNRRDSLEISYVKRNRQDEIPLDSIKLEILKVFGNSMNVNFNEAESIPLTPTGKLRVTICNVNRDSG